jgi:nicotinate-nucleotide adenylyltransferase
MERDGPSYMVDTLASLRSEAPDRPLCLIVGQDAFMGFPAWHRWRELFELAHIAVLRRPDAQALAFNGGLADIVNERQVETAAELPKTAAGRVVFLQVTQLAISATSIRRLIAAGQSPCYLMPDPVWLMIRSEKLYGFSSSAR